MIKQLAITGIHMPVGDDLRKYATKKIGHLDQYIPKESRVSAQLDIKLKEVKTKGQKECVCEAILQLPGETLTVSEGTVNIFAAVDIVEAKLKAQLRKYKMTHTNPRLHQRILIRLKHRPA